MNGLILTLVILKSAAQNHSKEDYTLSITYDIITLSTENYSNDKGGE